MPACDWLVIGGGIPALVSAFYLQQRGEQVCVVDHNQPSASRAGAGILSPLPPWRYPPQLEQFAAQGAAAYPALLDALGDACGYHRPGMMVLPQPQTDKRALARWCERGNTVQTVETPLFIAGGEQARRAVLHLPQVAVLQPRWLIKALRRRLARRVAVVRALICRADKVHGVAFADGSRLTANKVLLAAGAWSGVLCPPPAPAICPVRGQMLLYDPPPLQLPAVIFSEQDDFYLVQRRDGRLLAGSTTEHAGFVDAPTAAGTARLRRLAQTLLPLLAARSPRAAWAGLRPFAARPVIARHPRLMNLYLNSGHFRYGVTMAPAAAAHLLLVSDGKVAENQNPYRVENTAKNAAENGGSGRT